MTTTTRRRVHPDLAHHHPCVRRRPGGGWTWECMCGAASARSVVARLTWRDAYIGALIHSASIAP